MVFVVIAMRGVVGEGGICEKVELIESCGFTDCPQVCRDLFKEKYAAGECIYVDPSKDPQCVCFYHCPSTSSNTPQP